MATLWDAIGTPTAAPILQLAADGSWETCVTFPLGVDPMAAADAAERLSRTAKYLAMEVMWPGQAFVGTAWSAEQWADARTAAQRVVAAAPATAEAALTTLLDEMPGQTIESADLGAVNAWMSVGPERLWRRGDPVVTPLLDGRPDLMICTHPVAVEYSLSGNQVQWAAVILSEPDGSAHRLNAGKLAAAMSLFQPDTLGH
jgi:hypothetical protein